MRKKTSVINDPIGQTHSHVSSEHSCFVLLDLKSGDGRTDVRTTCAKTRIPTGRDFGLAEWIKKKVSSYSAAVAVLQQNLTKTWVKYV